MCQEKNNQYKIIRRELHFCPLCEEEHEVALIRIAEPTKVKGETIYCTVHSYLCERAMDMYEDGELADANLQRCRDAYREAHGLLTRTSIIAIREKYHITQEEFAIILGLGEKTIARYETSTIQDKPYDTLMRKFDDDYNFAYDMVKKTQGRIEPKKYALICQRLRDLILAETPAQYNDLQLKNCYLDYEQASSENGYRLLDIPKIKSMLAYFAKFTEQLFSVKLMKLFWYSDALAYLETGKAMTGLVYSHMPYGALPIGYKEIGGLDSVGKKIVAICDDYATQYVPKANKEIDQSLFTPEELDILHRICSKFKTISGSELSKIMHREEAYLHTEERQIIDFSMIQSLKAID